MQIGDFVVGVAVHLPAKKPCVDVMASSAAVGVWTIRA